MNDKKRISVYERAKKEFAQYTDRYVVTVEVDSGLNRVVHVGIPGDSIGAFTILTSRGILVIAGDYGDFVFSRGGDMFEFFRGDKEPNFDYWAEKLVAGDYEKYDVSVFMESVQSEFRDWAKDEDPEQADYLFKVLNDAFSLGLCSIETEAEALEHYRKFRPPAFVDHHYRKPDYFEGRCREYTLRYLWCCHAIQWTIQQYFEKQKAE